LRSERFSGLAFLASGESLDGGNELLREDRPA